MCCYQIFKIGKSQSSVKKVKTMKKQIFWVPSKNPATLEFVQASTYEELEILSACRPKKTAARMRFGFSQKGQNIYQNSQLHTFEWPCYLCFIMNIKATVLKEMCWKYFKLLFQMPTKRIGKNFVILITCRSYHTYEVDLLQIYEWNSDLWI